MFTQRTKDRRNIRRGGLGLIVSPNLNGLSPFLGAFWLTFHSSTLLIGSCTGRPDNPRWSACPSGILWLPVSGRPKGRQTLEGRRHAKVRIPPRPLPLPFRSFFLSRVVAPL